MLPTESMPTLTGPQLEEYAASNGKRIIEMHMMAQEVCTRLIGVDLPQPVHPKDAPKGPDCVFSRLMKEFQLQDAALTEVNNFLKELLDRI